MEPLYSVLLYNQNLSEYEPDIDKWLKSGIKIFWFGKEADVALLKIRTFQRHFSYRVLSLVLMLNLKKLTILQLQQWVTTA